MESEYTRAARLKWPAARIIGDGPHALYCERLELVTLYPHWLFAAADVARDHSNFRCKDEHSLVELEPVFQRRIQVRAVAALMERD